MDSVLLTAPPAENPMPRNKHRNVGFLLTLTDFETPNSSKFPTSKTIERRQPSF